jgi:rubrerythrin
MTTERNHDTISDEAPAASADLDAVLPPSRRGRRGVADRRAFLMGGVVLAGGAVLAACGNDDSQIPKTGTLPVQPSTTTTTAPGSAANDRVLLETAQSLELLAIQTYESVLDGDLVTDRTVVELFELFASQHQEHSDALTEAIGAAGGTPVTTPNEYLSTTLVEPETAELTDQTTVLAMVRDLENAIAQTYAEFGELFSTQELRQLGLSIGEIDARHITVLNINLDYSPVPVPLMPTSAALDPKGYVT